jgi:hypothetical protein
MSPRHLNSTDNAELRAKIDQAKARLPLPDLMRELNYAEKHSLPSAVCPFHEDEHPSFSVFQSRDGKGWQWKCHAGCGYGDEIAFLVKHFGISRREAIRRYFDMAGFPARAPSKSREYPKSLDSPKSRESLSILVSESPCVSVSPVSEGQGLGAEQQRFLQSLAVGNACARAGDNADRKRFKLARYMRGIEKVIGRQLKNDELLVAFTKWHQVSQPFLDPAKTRDDHWIAFLAELEKVRMPFGEGTLTKALENVSKLSLDQLPLIPDYANAPEKCRRLLALHRELFRLSANGTYFLSYRDAAKACKGLSYQEAHTIMGALVRLGVIKIISKGEPGLNGAKAAVFQYLLPEAENIAEEHDDEIPV